MKREEQPMQSYGITPVGTCRIHTPLRRGSARFPYEVMLSRNYGFVHSSREVIQQLDVLQGGGPVDPVLRPLVYRPNTTDAFFDKPPASPDLYFIEISSSKHVSIEGVPIQLNYANRYFGEFFANRDVTRRFWSMATNELAKERLAWLKHERQFQRLNPEDRQLLSLIRQQELSPDDVRADMAQIVERVGRENAVFVTHVNAQTADGAPILSRQRLIGAVRAAAVELDATLFDPTVAMKKHGQIQAMENDGLDLTHYTPAFADLLADEWFDRFIQPRFVAKLGHEPVVADPVLLDVGRLRSLLGEGGIVEASRSVREALREGRKDQDCYRLLGHIQFELGDLEGAIDSLEYVRGLHGMAEDDDVLLLEAHYGLGNFAAALTYGRSLISDEHETPQILRTSALAAEALDQLDEALTFWKRLFLLEEGAADAASAVLAIFQRRGEQAEMVEWADLVLETLPEHQDSFLTKWSDGVARRDIAGLLDTAPHSRLLSDGQVLALAAETAAAGLSSPAAALIAPRLVYAQVAPAIAAWGKKQGAAWRDQGLAALDSEDLALATDLIQASLRLLPHDGFSIRAKRALEQTLRREVRKAFVNKDLARVIALTDVAFSTAAHFPEIDSFVGRAAAKLGDLPKALTHLKKAADTDASAAAQVQLARVAVQAGDYLAALKAYGDVLDADDAEEWARTEADRKLTQLLSPTIRAARDSVAAGRIEYAWQLLEQANAHPANRERVGKEQERIHRALRQNLKGVDAADAVTREGMAQSILAILPEDPVALRLGASAAMRLHHFAEAREMWATLAKTAGDSAQIRSAIAKCDLWLDRARQKQAA
jgi:tetratricopeptide (TPR) repeat protein